MSLAPTATLSRPARRARAKFLDYFPDGFHDEIYVDTERAYKWDAHRRWRDQLGRDALTSLLASGDHREIADRAVRLESRTNLLFSFEKMALRDAVRTTAGSRRFAEALFTWLHGIGGERTRFEQWTDALGRLPRRQTRVATWPTATVFGFLARPRVHLYLKPNVTRRAAQAYGYDLTYSSTLRWETYARLLDFARQVRTDLADLGPRDQIDIQSFLWVLGSDEYPD
jgi:hypothetical protein